MAAVVTTEVCLCRSFHLTPTDKLTGGDGGGGDGGGDFGGGDGGGGDF